MNVKTKRTAWFLIIALIFGSSYIMLYKRPNQGKVGVDIDSVLSHLKNLEKIADLNGGSRSVVVNKATSDYILNSLKPLNNSFHVYTQDVPLNVQVDEQPPSLVLNYESYQKVFKPRLEVYMP
jgi:hypothetical protein